MTLTKRLTEYVRACFTGIWIESHEHPDAVAEIAQLCHDEAWRLATWDVDQGLCVAGAEAEDSDPLAAMRSVNSLATPDGAAILVLENFHRFIQSAEIVQTLAQQIAAGKHNRTFIVVLASVVNIPIELEKLFVVLEHELPDKEQLEEIARGIATEEGELPEGGELHAVLDAASGLSRFEAEGAFSLSLVRQGRITTNTVWELKTQALKKSGLLDLYSGGESFADLGGLTALKAFCRRALARSTHDSPIARPRGVLLLSPPGCGKSAFCKSLGNELGRPVLILDVGSLMGSLVGQTEERTRRALKIADAMAPCVLMIDEIEKAFAGAAGSGQSDSGVTARAFGTVLTWLNDHTSDVFVVCTSNDIQKLPPEMSRAERFDGVFFLDLPGREQKDAIWEQYVQLFELDADQPRPDDANFTGAEIRSCCRLARLLDVPMIEAAQNVVPVAVTAAESVERLRGWASGRCLDAEQGGIYQYRGANAKTRRRVKRDTALN